MELVKELRELQETILQEEKERYEREKKEFEKGVGSSIGYAYIDSRGIDDVFLKIMNKLQMVLLKCAMKLKSLLISSQKNENIKMLKHILTLKRLEMMIDITMISF